MGRPQFETVVASAPKERMVFIDLGETLNVAGSGDYQKYLYAPPGYIGEVTAVYATIPLLGMATGGTHLLSMGYSPIYLARGESPYNQAVTWYYNYWNSAPTNAFPPTNQPQAAGIRGAIFDDVTPFIFAYVNKTTVAQTGRLDLRVIYKLRQVAK